MFWMSLGIAWLLAVVTILAVYGRSVRAALREPVWRRPVLIVESDDWGAGPPRQAEALARIADLLAGYQDRDGRSPVMTLALILETADRVDPREGYRSVRLADPACRDILDQLHDGHQRGVFGLSLHGREHYWPEALLTAAGRDDSVGQWLRASPEAGTEDLPAPLQSRWTDATTLPSRDLDAAVMVRAAQDEMRDFAQLFAVETCVVVPPTFIWNDTVEQGWQAGGAEVLVTPGARYHARGADGAPLADGTVYHNGARSNTGLLCLVRNDYFEPFKGHKAERGIAALRTNTLKGRPTLLETHRINFIDEHIRESAFDELQRLYRLALREFPDLAFLSTEEVARALVSRDPRWIEQRWSARLVAWHQRLQGHSRLRKLLMLTGVWGLFSLVAGICKGVRNGYPASARRQING